MWIHQHTKTYIFYVNSSGYSGADCAVPKSAIPVIVGLVDSSTCDVHNSACLNLQMRTENVSSSANFVCKIVVRRVSWRILLRHTSFPCRLPATTARLCWQVGAGNVCTPADETAQHGGALTEREKLRTGSRHQSHWCLYYYLCNPY